YTECGGTITQNWIYTDACGREITQEQVITVLPAPAATFAAVQPMEISCDEAAMFVASDLLYTNSGLGGCLIEGTVLGTLTETDTGCGFVITQDWIYIDACGREITQQQIITVIDVTAPILSNLPEEEITVQCGNIPDVPTITVTDDCDDDVEMNYVETETTPDNEGNYIITRTWTFTDDCDNVSTFIQTVNVIEIGITTTTPSIDICIEDVSIDLNSFLEGVADGNGTWTDDNDSGGLSGDDFDPSVVNLGSYQFTYTSSDDTCNVTISIIINVNDDCVVLPCSTDDLYISRVVTHNGDIHNDAFKIKGLELCGFTYDVKILNRWGHMVFESGNYQNNWTGYNSEGGMTIGSSDKLPAGTYYYVVNIVGSGFKPITGYIYLGH
ncbi:MAG: hypothetical protein COA67_10250, partial [Lutibacter sp.]